MSHEDQRCSGTILIADDEETFLHATVEYLRDEGFACDCAPDASAAAERLAQKSYDLLISDVMMPGNCELEFIGRLEEIARGVPVILVTGYPSIEMASRSVKLPVVAYLCKPIDLNQLMAEIRFCLRRSWAYRAIRHSMRRLGERCVELGRVEKAILDPVYGRSNAPIEAVVGLAMEDLTESLDELGILTRSLARLQNEDTQTHAVADCRAATMERALVETIRVLERTKGAFRSKQLARLRHRLESLVDKMDELQDSGESAPRETPDSVGS
jgi:FixJ family two-component response regulator